MKKIRKHSQILFLLGLIVFLVAGCKKNKPENEIVRLFTNEISQVTYNSAVVSGKVISNIPLDEVGVCYGINAMPTIENEKKAAFVENTLFSCELSNLQSDKTYYVRTYAVTTNGNIYYGNEESFNVLTTYTISNSTDYTLYDVLTPEYDAASNLVGRADVGLLSVGSTSQVVTAVSSAENVEVVFRFSSDGDSYVTALKYPLTKGSNTTITLTNQTQVHGFKKEEAEKREKISEEVREKQVSLNKYGPNNSYPQGY